MKKVIAKGLALAFVGSLLMAGSALATPTILGMYDSGAEAVRLTDTDGTEDSVKAFLLFEFAGFHNELTFGLYDFSVTSGGVVLGDTLELFEGADEGIPHMTGFFPPTTSVDFDLTAGTATANGTTKNIGETFGFYLTTPEDNGYTYYSHTELNPDNFNHTLIFDLYTNSWDNRDYFLGSDVLVAFEDLYGGGDKDYNDFVVGVTDVAPVPEPATMLLFGTGLVGLAGYSRKRMHKNK